MPRLTACNFEQHAINALHKCIDFCLFYKKVEPTRLLRAKKSPPSCGGPFKARDHLSSAEHQQAFLDRAGSGLLKGVGVGRELGLVVLQAALVAVALPI